MKPPSAATSCEFSEQMRLHGVAGERLAQGAQPPIFNRLARSKSRLVGRQRGTVS
ncbi:MAG: hypothetical protein ACPG77_00255 [Nannocystaceae bacterium]